MAAEASEIWLAHGGGEAAALDERRAATRIFSQFGSRGPSSCADAVERDDLAVEATLGPGADGPLVALDRERLHVLAADVPLLGDHLGASGTG